jgi:hypothetical protein
MWLENETFNKQGSLGIMCETEGKPAKYDLRFFLWEDKE